MSSTDLPTTTDTGLPGAETDGRGQALAERLFADMLSGLELLTVELGRRLGLYRALHDAGPTTADRFADRAAIAQRYAREWLEQQAAAGIIDVVTAGSTTDREYALPAAHVGVLLDETDPLHLAGGAMGVEGIALTLPEVAAAYRTGTGVGYERFGDEIRRGIASLNRPMFTHELAGWVRALPDVAARLDSGGVVLDAGCGSGWSSVALAKAFPAARVVGVDLDTASVAEARRNVESEGLSDRVRVVEANSADGRALQAAAGARCQLVTVFEALHDMGEPVRALAAFAEVLAPGGAVLVADERVGAEFTAPADELDRLNYAFSVLHCLPATMAESTHIANGTVLRPDTVRSWAQAAGFDRIEELPIDNELWRFYRLSE
ncbi:class I SAM-dependent methyltransferase [Nocardia cyriacigeorgica]|uniref:class I SAM-dependent methyltransferase n=1 Tax=Nocardia cyriacigeorgica TaxID=135487 RepID=UPI0013B9DA47|nr:class I SAM-dependent methyltransferase [Nocardia cyriacigeorgica]NEW53375.1 class I SAM-dependent methyltransferase [Nocardia cyriacigeorgica]